MKATAIFKIAQQIGPEEWGMAYKTREIDLPDNFLNDGFFVGLSFANTTRHDSKELAAAACNSRVQKGGAK